MKHMSRLDTTATDQATVRLPVSMTACRSVMSALHMCMMAMYQRETQRSDLKYICQGSTGLVNAAAPFQGIQLQHILLACSTCACLPHMRVK